MKIFVTGTRGIPNIPGGIESHCQQLYPLIVKQGHEVKLSRRKPYVRSDTNETKLQNWSGVQLVDNFAPKIKSLEALVHTFIAILEAKKWKADIVHIHAIGPSIMSPIARLLGLKVVITHHGPDYKREKWGQVARFVLRVGEKMGGLFAHDIIAISQVIQKIIKKHCHRESHLIYNGVQIPKKIENTAYIESLNLIADNYIIAIARFVPEKGLHDLINAYKHSSLKCKLVLVGSSDHEDDYSRHLQKMASVHQNIILTGYLTGNKLNQILSHARLFVLPSYFEGLPIALLEALSYGIMPLVSNIPANLEVGLDSTYYFQCKNTDELHYKLKQLWFSEFSIKDKKQLINLVKTKYNWQVISEQTLDVYYTVLGKK